MARRRWRSWRTSGGGCRDEWHLDFASSFEHLEFDLLPRPLQVLVPPRPLFGHTGLESVGPVGDAVDRDGPEQLLVESLLVVRAAVRPVGDQRPERFEDLERRLEADRARLHTLTGRRL